MSIYLRERYVERVHFLLEQGQIPVRTVFRLSLLETIDSRDTSYLNMINELSRKFKAQTKTNGFFT